METRSLGRTGIDVGALTLGTWGLAGAAYGPVDRATFEAVVARALDVGITSFDLAPLWGDGEAERVVGEATRGKPVTLVTRTGAIREGRTVARRFDAASIQKDCEASLTRLGRERIDVLLLHHPSEEALGEAREAMFGLVKAGKIAAWGVSTSVHSRARGAILSGASVVALPYNLLFSDLLHDLSDDVVTEKVGVLATSPLDFGMLSGRFDETQRFKVGDHRRNRWTPLALRVRVRQAEMLRFLVKGDIASLACAAVRFVLASKLVSSCVIGPRTIEQLDELAGCADGPPWLPEDDLSKIGQVLAAAGA